MPSMTFFSALFIMTICFSPLSSSGLLLKSSTSMTRRDRQTYMKAGTDQIQYGPMMNEIHPSFPFDAAAINKSMLH